MFSGMLLTMVFCSFSTKAFGASILDDEANGSFLGFNTLGQFKLDERPGKIVFLVVGLEVDIAFQIISKVSQPKFERYQADGIVQVVIIVVVEKVFCQ